MNDELVNRARGALVGLAVGDALGQPTEGLTPLQIRQQWGRITDFLTDEPSGSDDTEYALFSARLLLKNGRALTSGLVASAWREHLASQTGGFKGAGFSEMMAIANLRSGMSPPACGMHLHSWSDGLAMRVAPFGVAAAGEPELAARFAAIDGAVSHSGEGVFSGQAVAAAVAEAMGGASLEQVFAAALRVIPADSWTARAVSAAITYGSQANDFWQALPHLHEAIACTYYPWADLGPEAVGLAFGVLAAAHGQFEAAVLGGVNIGRDTDTIAAIAGAIAGAHSGFEKIPPQWVQRIQLARGVCILAVQGMNILQTADDLAALATRWRNES